MENYSKSEIVEELAICKMARLYLSGISIKDLSARFGVPQGLIGIKLRSVFLRTADSDGFKMDHPIILKKVRLGHVEWIHSISRYESKLKKVI